MLKTYTATISGDQIEWDQSDRPTLARPTKVMVTVLEPSPGQPSRGNGVVAAAILAEIASRGGLKEFGDPAEWQREVRKDRPQPGREDE